MLQNHYQQGKLVGMICAGTLAAKAAKIALGNQLTSHPSVKADLEQSVYETHQPLQNTSLTKLNAQITSTQKKVSFVPGI